MVGGEGRRIASDDRQDGGMAFERSIQKSPYPTTVPAPGMGKIPIQGQVGFVKRTGRDLLAGIDREIEDSRVQEIDMLPVSGNEIQGCGGLFRPLGRGAEQDIDVGPDPRCLEVRQDRSGRGEIHPLPECIEDGLRSGLQPQLEHDAAGSAQGLAEIPPGEVFGDSGKSVPWRSCSPFGQSGQEGRTQGIVQEVDEGRFCR